MPQARCSRSIQTYFNLRASTRGTRSSASRRKATPMSTFKVTLWMAQGGMFCQSFHNCVMFHLLAAFPMNAAEQEKYYITNVLNSLTAKSVPAETKLVLFGRYVLNIYVGIVQYFLRKMKTQRAKIYLPTQRTNPRISYKIN